MKILVTGGCGYIGSHTVRHLIKAQHEVTVLDNLSTGHRWAIPKNIHFIEGDVRDLEHTAKILKEKNIEGVIHFAAYIEVEESAKEPWKYYNNNTYGTMQLLEACRRTGIKYFVFSSTATIYGNTKEIPIKEATPLSPINVYGNTKLASERMIQDFSSAPSSNMNYIILRYFNVAGATEDASTGQFSEKATHLIKIASECVTGKRKEMSIYGQDYNTPDGTCVRDYVHVDDLADAHVLAIEHLAKTKKSDIFNCGYGEGHSVNDVIKTMKEVTGHNFIVHKAGRRVGDPDTLIADNTKMTTVLGWKPKHNDLAYICKTAWLWEKNLTENPDKFK